MKIIEYEDQKELGERIRAERKTQQLTQHELAALSGVGVVTIYNIERGKRTTQIESIVRVVQALGMGMALVPPGEARSARSAPHPQQSSEREY